MQLEYTVGAELEFYLLGAEGQCIADLASGKFPQKRFAVLGSYEPNLKQFLETLVDYNITPESGPGQFEVQLAPENEGVDLANKLNEFKAKAEVAAIGAGLIINFEAKPLIGQCGSALHVHYSTNLFDPWGLIANKGVVLIKRDADNEFVHYAIGGMLEKMAQDVHIFIPTPESRLRIEPWFNAPTKICWGRNNRSTALRIPDAKPKRIEHRVSGSDVNFSAAINAVVNAAEYGILNKITPPEAIFGNAWEDKYDLPKILGSFLV